MRNFSESPSGLRLTQEGMRSHHSKRKRRQEISPCLKWIIFITNFAIFLCGIGISLVGMYLFLKDAEELVLFDILFNPAIMLSLIGSLVVNSLLLFMLHSPSSVPAGISVITTCAKHLQKLGCSISAVSFLGAVGALRDSIFLLKTFATCVFFYYVLVVMATFALFVLFYSETAEGFTAHSILVYAIRNYHLNRNLAEIVDSLQESLKCCGVASTAQGYRDWNLSYQFNCSASNPQPEKCSVPYSCCRKSVVSEAAGSSNSVLPAMRSLECWQNTLNKRPQDLEHDIYTRGCLQPLRSAFESSAAQIAFAVTVIVVPVCISICLTNILAKQIDQQRCLLAREARRKERLRKRERRRRERARTNDAYEDEETSNNDTSAATGSSQNPLTYKSSLEKTKQPGPQQ